MTNSLESEKKTTSIDLLWEQALREVDAWVDCAKKREDVLLNSTKQFAENLKRNQQNIKELAEQFSSELRAWDRKSKEEFLTATASLHYIFPVKSFEEINEQLDNTDQKAADLTSTALGSLVSDEQINRLIASVEQYVEFRRKNREQYVNSVKETASIIRDNQRALLEIMSNQVKNLFFPFHKYV